MTSHGFPALTALRWAIVTLALAWAPSSPGSIVPQDPEPPSSPPPGPCHPLSASAGNCGEEEECEDDPGNGPMSPAASSNPVYYRYGSVLEGATDLRLPAQSLKWSLGRSYNSTVGVAQTGLGNRWMGGATDRKFIVSDVNLEPLSFNGYLLINAASRIQFSLSLDDPPDPLPDTLVIPAQDDSTLEAVLVMTSETTFDLFVRDQYRDDLYEFYSPTHPVEAERGKLKEQTTRHWKEQGRVGYLYSYDGSARLDKITAPRASVSDPAEYTIDFTFKPSSRIIEKVRILEGSGPICPRSGRVHTTTTTLPSPTSDLAPAVIWSR